jgi:hypothetical protein
MLIKVQHAEIVGAVVVVVIGLLWSIAVMSNWVPVASAEMRSAAVYPALRGWGHNAAAQ